jgi:hypothetical protein
MTGAAFACLLPLLKAKATADPAFAEAFGAAPAPADGGDAGAATAAALGGPLAATVGVLGRVNLTFSDLPYVALWGEDVPPPRPRVAYVSWEEGALSDGDGGGGEAGAGGGQRRGDLVRGVVRRLQRVLPRGDDGRPARVSLLRARGPRMELEQSGIAAPAHSCRQAGPGGFCCATLPLPALPSCPLRGCSHCALNPAAAPLRRAAPTLPSPQVRLSLVSRSAALAELDDESAVAALCGELVPGGAVTAVPYVQYAAGRYARYSSEAAPPVEAPVAADGETRVAKRARVEGAGEEAAPAAAGSKCTIM